MDRRAALAASLLLVWGCSAKSGSGGSASSHGTTTAPVTSAPTNPGNPPPPPAPVNSTSTLLAGAAEVNVTPPVGVPLAGYGGGARRQMPPNIGPGYDHFLNPSTGIRDPIMARALYVSDGKTAALFLTIDGIATTADIVNATWNKAHALGSTLPFEGFMVCASHTHSGPGCLTQLPFWEILACDGYQDSVFQAFTDGCAQAVLQAEKNAVPSVVGAGSMNVTNATRNRRAGVSPVFTATSIDPELLVLRVDRASNGAPIATLWNFAIHGTSFGPDNHLFSADIMGGANTELSALNVGVPLFVNSGEGDISPQFSGDTGVKQGGKLLADAIYSTRSQVQTQASLPVLTTTETVDFGQPYIDLTVQRVGSFFGPAISQQGWFTLLAAIGGQLGYNLKIPQGWLEQQFRYQAFRIGKLGFASVPGEAIHTIAIDLKVMGSGLGYDRTFVCGLANGHMSYIVTEPEYWVGGYEGYSTLYGPQTAVKLEDSVQRQLTKVKP